MSKVCPNCNYPNPDNLDTCFKCGADISEATMRQDRVRANLERNRRREAQRSTRENDSVENVSMEWNLYNFSKLNVGLEHESYKGIDYLNCLLKTIDRFAFTLLILFVLGFVCGAVNEYNNIIEIENNRVEQAKQTNKELKELYDQQMESYKELRDLQRQLGSPVTSSFPDYPNYLSENFNEKVKEEALKSVGEIIFGGLILLFIFLLIWWGIRSRIINTIEHEKSLKVNFKYIKNYLEKMEQNLLFIKNFYSNYEENSLENLEINNSEIIEGNYPETVEDAK